ncbi:MAG: hypothetical protein MUC69_07185 [Gemmatimonadales bacterium]|nr:hypothetical protein [Gemmatimonadales bacterium]
MRNRRGAFLALALLLGGAAIARAQDLSAGFQAGPSIGIGSFGEGRSLGTGWYAGLSVPLAFRTSRFGAEFDAGYSELPYTWAEGRGRVGVWVGNLSATMRILPRWTVVRPYVALGLGVYYVEVPERNSVAPSGTAAVGVHVGSGKVRAFAEARYHYVLTWERAMQFLPVTIGIRYAPPL